ncbi:unnamed protein product [Oncorhynchus mykiss]|uniref:DSBA-like thioredoxin domain-containing protein n=1 Tax=Oncorhynchus mykiss TaxID=8022 RepID=A0A060XTD5_ONCMY|nr:unnamed protein product [Oncorhynchus mykiss]
MYTFLNLKTFRVQSAFDCFQWLNFDIFFFDRRTSSWWSKMASSRKVIELFYDVVSPYSWLGFEVMCRYRNVWNIDLKLRPAFLGGIMQGSGNKPPGLVPNKFLYMTTDLHRLAQYFQVPISPPADPFEAMFEKGAPPPCMSFM